MSLRKAAKIAIEQAMDLKSHEIALIICDKKSRKISNALLEAAKFAKESILIEIEERESNGEEPPELVANALLHSDVALIPTTKSMSHTRARKAASDKGVRIATLPGITEEIMGRTLEIDYEEMETLSRKLAEYLTKADSAEIKTSNDSVLKLKIKGRKALPDTGVCHSPGSFSNLPAGEAYIAPLEGTASGTLTINGSLAGYGLLKNLLEITIKNGYINKLIGDGADFLNGVYKKYGKQAWNIAELGIGTNPKAKISGNVLEDEKVKGTIHIAFGDNSTFGGTVSIESHLDGVISKATLILDDNIIIKQGKLNI